MGVRINERLVFMCKLYINFWIILYLNKIFVYKLLYKLVVFIWVIMWCYILGMFLLCDVKKF